MNTSAKPLVRAVALGLSLTPLQTVFAQPGSKPIVDVRFDAQYRQVLPSNGDEWAPTWGRNDVLYTGNDDGDNFGGVPMNAMAFGKLEGNDPYALKGTTVNGMRDFREDAPKGPRGAMWKTLDSYQIGKTLYRFAPCGFAEQAAYSCLLSSGDGGKTWSGGAAGAGAKPLFKGTRFSTPAFIDFTEDAQAMFGRVGEYVYAVAHREVDEGEDRYLVGRVPSTKLAQGNAADWAFRQQDGSWKNNFEQATTMANSRMMGQDNANWKTMNTYSVDGVLYMFVTRCLYPKLSGDPKGRHVFQNSSIIKSTDNGRTWTRSGADNYAKPMFPGKRFGTAYFVWYGKDGAATVDNADRYVYAISNNGHFENGDDYVLGRVLKSKLPNLSAADWSSIPASRA